MNRSELKILLIEDDVYFLRQLKKKVSEYGLIQEAENFKRAQSLLLAQEFDVAIIDLNLDDQPTGIELLKMAKERGIFSIVLTDDHSPHYIQKAYELGCTHYLTKDQFDSIIHILLRERLDSLSGQDQFREFFKNEFITNDKNLMDEIRSLKARVTNPRPILILGETGVGKGELAKFIHRLKFKGENSFIPVNVSAINGNLVESELFGHKKGSFTGAHETKLGKLELAHHGTLFLDEIASMPLAIQSSLLKAIEEKSFYPVGGTKLVKSDFQLISATCEEIYSKIKNESFRIDLFHRINSIILLIPPLRERRADIPLLINYFLSKGSRKIHIKEDALKMMTSYAWPGNVRELKATVDSLIDQSRGIIAAKNLPETIKRNEPPTETEGKRDILSKENFNLIKKNGIKSFLEKMQSAAVEMALNEEKGNTSKAIKLIDLAPSTFYRHHKNLREKGTTTNVKMN